MIVVTITWLDENQHLHSQAFGPFEVRDDLTHLDEASAFVKAWAEANHAPVGVTLWLVSDPVEALSVR